MPLPIPPREPDSVPVLNSTPLPAFPQAWQLRPSRDAIILTVKGTFDLVSNAHATPAEELDLPLGSVPFEGAEEALRYPGDTAFFKPRCDVLLAGHAYAPARPPFVRAVQIDVGRALSYSVAAIGDRVWRVGAPSEPARFDRIELRPERAFGGPGHDANPLGVGLFAEEGSPLPNLERPDALIRSERDRPEPALVSPLHETWEARTRFAGSYGGNWAEERAPYFPDDFHYDYFQAAPADLQIPYPRGDEWYRLRGVRPGDEVLEGRLPGLRLRAFAQRPETPDALEELPLNLDTLWFDTDALRLACVWRGAIETTDLYGGDLACLFVLAEPLDAPAPVAEVHRRFRQAYAEEHERAPEETSPELPRPGPVAPEGYVPPKGLTTRQALALGLPAWAATVESEPLEPAAPPPPRPVMGEAELDAALAGEGSLAGLDLSRCDLRGRALAGRDLSGAVLLEANLSGLDLRGASLERAVLSEANLEGADLRGARLGGAVLDGADLREARLEGAHLEGASLARAHGPGARLDGATLDGASLPEADLSRATLDGASLVGADLTDARLEDATLVGADLTDVRLYGVIAPRAKLDEATMEGCRIDGAMLAGASLIGVRAADSSMRQCDFSDCDLRGADLTGSVLEDATFDRANLNQVTARECRWPRVRAVEATFLKSDLMKGYFEGAVLRDCDLRGANLYEAETFRARFEGCRLEGAILGVSGLAGR